MSTNNFHHSFLVSELFDGWFQRNILNMLSEDQITVQTVPVEQPGHI